MLAVDGHHALVADLDHGLRLAPDLVHREAAALLLVVVEREAAVAAAVHAVARDVHRREGHDAVVVDLVLHVPGRLGHLGQELGVVDGEQGGDLGAGERLDRERLLEDVADAGGVGFGVGGELGADLVVVDEVAAAVAVAVDLVALDDRLGREPFVCLGHVVPSGGRPPRPGKWRASWRGVPEGADDSTPPVKRKAVVSAKRPRGARAIAADSTRVRRVPVGPAGEGDEKKGRPRRNANGPSNPSVRSGNLGRLRKSRPRGRAGRPPAFGPLEVLSVEGRKAVRARGQRMPRILADRAARRKRLENRARFR